MATFLKKRRNPVNHKSAAQSIFNEIKIANGQTTEKEMNGRTALLEKVYSKQTNTLKAMAMAYRKTNKRNNEKRSTLFEAG